MSDSDFVTRLNDASVTARADATERERAGDRRPTGDRDATTRRSAVRRAMFIGAWVWPAFTLLDLYMCLVLFPRAPFALFLAYRVAEEALILWVYRRARDPEASADLLARWQNLSFFTAALTIALMALHLGGPESAYMHGISIVCLVRAAVIPEPWHRSIGNFAVFALVFPFVIATAAMVSPEARAAWFDAPSLAVFAANYVFVLASALVGSASGHSVWAAQQQVYKARRLGRYRLQAPLGRGGMGEVWLAWDGSLKRNVALKILRTDGAPDISSVRRFEREAQNASRLRVPHTIQVYDFGASDDGVYYIAMEYLPGADLRRIVDRWGPLPPARAIRFILQACLSLEEAHGVGIIHRDVKPQNLFVTTVGDDQDFVKLLDFGIAQFNAVRDESADLTRSGLVRGTPAFLAPELWRGERADERSDIYAVGATLYCLLTGTAPFEGQGVGDLIRAHTAEAPDVPSRRAGREMPPGLDALVLRCLAKSPADRYPSVRDLIRALEAVPLSRPWTIDDARAFWREAGASLLPHVDADETR